MVLTCFGFCTENDQIHAAIWQSLHLCAKNYGVVDRWVGGRVEKPVKGLLTAIKKDQVG